jgi:hypothetical protein
LMAHSSFFSDASKPRYIRIPALASPHSLLHPSIRPAFSSLNAWHASPSAPEGFPTQAFNAASCSEDFFIVLQSWSQAFIRMQQSHRSHIATSSVRGLVTCGFFVFVSALECDGIKEINPTSISITITRPVNFMVFPPTESGELLIPAYRVLD